MRMSTSLTSWSRRLGLLLMIVGALTVAWAIVVWRWEDPLTALYTMYEQHELAARYARRADRFATPAPVRPNAREVAARGVAATKEIIAAEERAVHDDARRYRLESREGDPLGRIIVPRLGLNMIFVDGTRDSTLERGPGRALQTFMPGENQLVYIAGHRTTFLAPFSHIDTLRRGDRVTLELPYATFVYAVTRHLIVAANDLKVLRSGHRELLALQACHPRFFATHRYIVYARPAEVIPTGQLHPYRPPA
jgi:sortase A